MDVIKVTEEKDIAISKSVSQNQSMWDKIEDYCKSQKPSTNRSAFITMLADDFFKNLEAKETPEIKNSDTSDKK
jgi:hypothetical protein